MLIVILLKGITMQPNEQDFLEGDAIPFEISKLPDSTSGKKRNATSSSKPEQKDLDKSLRKEPSEKPSERFDEHGFYKFS